ncbi:acylphosphatase-2-like isoform X1 [Syngnathus typhle]|uniref:acylphosphatase-2-like isoform X1 n=2 Tax=Syngnathus typhle TaxID=161592 RepID=UPI002A6B3A2B|nr:acylphosphatase-2-like isoform X1 [Syngnathus typhle]
MCFATCRSAEILTCCCFLLAGVCFRMYTEKEAAQAGVVGWVKNTRGGTVVGQLQGPADAVEHMKEWLSKKGSPSSHITRTSFNNERTLSALEMSSFSTRY